MYNVQVHTVSKMRGNFFMILPQYVGKFIPRLHVYLQVVVSYVHNVLRKTVMIFINAKPIRKT